MIQNIFVISAVVAAAIYLVAHFVRLNKLKDDKCTGCAVNKIYQMKIEKSKLMETQIK